MRFSHRVRGCGRGRGQGHGRGHGCGGVQGRATGNTAGVSNIDNWIPIPNLRLDTAPPTTPFTETPGPRISLTSDSNPVDFLIFFLMRL